MYHLQAQLSPQHSVELDHSCQEILKIAREIVLTGQLERKFIVFPLLMVGVVTHHPATQAEILGLVRALQGGSAGRNSADARKLLEKIFEQTKLPHRDPSYPSFVGDAMEGEGSAFGMPKVDWIHLVEEKGLHLVTCQL